AVNGRSMSMLSPLSSSIYALNVPDNSITQKKLATDYVSSISINGQQITNKGSGLNIVGGDGVSLTFDPGTQSLLIGASGLTESARDKSKGNYVLTANSSVHWSEAGNNITCNSSAWLGTSTTTSVNDIVIMTDDNVAVKIMSL